jgi:TIR domain-containing protein
MAYVPSFEHDIFISYAHADNGATERVSAFVRDLVQRLTLRLGARAFHKPQDWVFFDRPGLKAGDEFSPKLERSARRSAVLISLLSPSYLQAPFCIRETEWFLESKRLARDPIERRLIPIVLNHTDEEALRQFPQFATSLLRLSLCTPSTASEPGSALWNEVLETLASQIADHLRNARRKHGAVYVGQAYEAAESFRAGLIDELRGFLCIPEYAIFGQEAAVRQALAEAKLAVHILGATGAEAVDNVEAILLSLQHCPGKTVGYLPPGQQLGEEEREAIDAIQADPHWTRPECTPVELAQILTRELESFRLPDPSTPIALACDKADLNTVLSMAREIHSREAGAFAVGTPDFLAEPGSLAFVAWKKLLTKSPSVVVYWGQGHKQYLDTNVARYLPAAKLGRAWYVSLAGPDTEGKRDWQPGDPDTEKIVDENESFDYERLRGFLKRVRERARQ